MMNSITSKFYQGYPVFQASSRIFNTNTVCLLQNDTLSSAQNLRKLRYHKVANLAPTVSDFTRKPIFSRLYQRDKICSINFSRVLHKRYSMSSYFSSTKSCRNYQQSDDFPNLKCENKTCDSRHCNQVNNTRSSILASDNVWCGISSFSGRISQNVYCFQPNKFLHTSTTANADAQKNDEQLQTFKPIYRFKYIILFKIISRFKIYQTFFTLAILQPLIKAYMSGDVSPEFTITALGVAGVAVVMLYVMSIYIRRTVGILSISEDFDLLKLSHLSFWGKKKDVFIPVNEVIPFADASESYRNVYQIIQLYSKPDKWYLFSQHGNLYDDAIMETIFGKVNE